MRAGWVHQLRLYPYSVPEGDRFVAMGKVYIKVFFKFTNCVGEAFTTNFSGFFTAMGNCEREWRSVSCSLYLHGWVSYGIASLV